MLMDSGLDLKSGASPAGDLTDYGGKRSLVSWIMPRVMNHSAFHQLGFDDYYPMKYFEGDIMAYNGLNVHDIHFIDIAETALSEENTVWGRTEVASKGYMHFRGDGMDRSQLFLSQADKVDRAKQKVNEQAERKQK